jgi:hypothetical protein
MYRYRRVIFSGIVCLALAVLSFEISVADADQTDNSSSNNGLLHQERGY